MAESWLTRTMQNMSGPSAWLWAAGIWLVLAVPVPLALVWAEWNNAPQVIVKTSAAFPNADGSVVAVLETIDPMAVGVGELNVVHILRRGSAVDHKSKDSATVAFYDDAMQATPELHWIDRLHLSVRYDARGSPPFMLALKNGVEISYVPLAGTTPSQRSTP